MWGIDGEDVWGMAVVLGLSLIPVVSATILSYRNFRRRWWLAAPGALVIVLIPLLAWLLSAIGAVDRTEGPVLAIVLAMFIGSWIAVGLFLAALAIAGPKLPVIDVREVF